MDGRNRTHNLKKVMMEQSVESAERKVITPLPHYRALTAHSLLPPQLHVQMGMENTANTAIRVFWEFINEECEPLTLTGESVRTRVQTAI
jgi:hypothetical protein